MVGGLVFALALHQVLVGLGADFLLVSFALLLVLRWLGLRLLFNLAKGLIRKKILVQER